MLFVNGHVEIRLIQRKRLDEVRVFEKYFTDLLRNSAIDIKPRSHKNKIRAPLNSGSRRHRRMHTILAGLIARRRHHAPLSRRTAHSNRFSPVPRIVALLDRGEKRVHIDVNDFTNGKALGIHRVRLNYNLRLARIPYNCKANDERGQDRPAERNRRLGQFAKPINLAVA